MISLSYSGQNIRAALAENPSTKALLANLEQRPLTIAMDDYANIEKVGLLRLKSPIPPLATESIESLGSEPY